jgi:hypothetical protein
MLSWILVPLGIGCAIAVALALVALALALAYGAVMLLVVAPAKALRAHRMCRTPEGRAEWLAQEKQNPRAAAMLDWIAAKRAGDKAAQSAARERIRSLSPYDRRRSASRIARRRSSSSAALSLSHIAISSDGISIGSAYRNPRSRRKSNSRRPKKICRRRRAARESCRAPWAREPSPRVRRAV